MKVMCVYTPAGPSHVRSGWGRVFMACGHQFLFWRPEIKCAFDAFSEYEPDLFIGTTYDLDSSIFKCIAARPEMKVILFASAWGPYLKDIDLKKYPLVVVNEQEKRTIEKLKKQTGKPDYVFIHAHNRWLDGTMCGWNEIGVDYHGVLNAADTFLYMNGQAKPELSSDVVFVGGYWGYKSRNLDRFLLPLCHPKKQLNVKIYGNSQWPVANYLGQADDKVVKDLFASAKVCPNVSESHSTDYGFDVIERVFKTLSSGGVCISDYVEEARDLFAEDELPMARTPQTFEEHIRYLISARDYALQVANAGRKKVLQSHTYFDRVHDILFWLQLQKDANNAIEKKKVYVNAR